MRIVLFVIALLLAVLPSFGQAVNLQVHDTRNDTDSPTLYKRVARLDFKFRNVIGVPGSGLFSTNLTIAPWVNDGTGNKHHQLSFNDGGIFYRVGANNSSSWESWRKLVVERADGIVEVPGLLADYIHLNGGWDNVIGASYAGNKHQLIGTYQGWDPNAIYIAGYNINAELSVSALNRYNSKQP